MLNSFGNTDRALTTSTTDLNASPSPQGILEKSALDLTIKLNRSTAETLQQALQGAETALSQFATDRTFTTKMNVAFGDRWNHQVANQLFQVWAAHDFRNLPKLEIRLGAEINNANGAFASATNTIYISRDFLAQNASNPNAVTSVLIEEIGHAIDFRINKTDAAGDEGDIFSRLVRGEKMSASELLQLKAEDDHAVVNINGKATAIEMSQVAISSFGNKLFQAVRGTDDSIYTRSTTDGSKWTGWTKTDDSGKTPSAVSMSVFGNKLFQAVRGTDDSIYTRSTTDGSKWTGWTKTDDSGKTPSAVSMSVFGNKLFQAVRGTDDSIYTRSTTDGSKWTGWTKTDDSGKTPSAVSMSVFGNKLFQAVRGTDNSIYTRSTTDGSKWTGWTKTDDSGKTPSAVSMSVFGNKLFQAVRGTDNSIYTRSTTDGSKWTGWTKTDDSGKTPSAVSMSVFGNKLFQTVQGTDNSIYTRSTTDGSKWTGWTKTDDIGKTITEVDDIWEKSIANVNPKITTVLDNLNGIRQITDPGGNYPGQCVSFVKTYTQSLGITMGVFKGPDVSNDYNEGAQWGFYSPPLPNGKFDKIQFTGSEKPQVGDIIFFDGTYDGNGKANGWGHVAVVQSVLSNGRIIIQESNGNAAAWEDKYYQTDGKDHDQNSDRVIGTSVTRREIDLTYTKNAKSVYQRTIGWLRLKL